MSCNGCMSILHTDIGHNNNFLSDGSRAGGQDLTLLIMLQQTEGSTLIGPSRLCSNWLDSGPVLLCHKDGFHAQKGALGALSFVFMA